MRFYPVAISLQHTNTDITKITPLKTNTQNKDKQIHSHSYTDSEGHITANEYSVEKGKT
jgi:hypothetical protein